LPENSDGQIMGFPLLISFHHGSSCSYITRGMNNKPDGGCSSETSHPMDMINIFCLCLILLSGLFPLFFQQEIYMLFSSPHACYIQHQSNPPTYRVI
jgi:hypothetical protein